MTLLLTSQDASQPPSHASADDPPPRVNADVAIVLDETSANMVLSYADPARRPSIDSVGCVIARCPTKDSYDRYLKKVLGESVALVTTEFLQAPDGCAFRVVLPRGDSTPVLEASLYIAISNSREPERLLEQLKRGERGTRVRLLLTGAIFRVAESTLL